MELRSALVEAKASARTVNRAGVRVRDERGVRNIALHVLPVNPRRGADFCYLVQFEEASMPNAAGEELAPAADIAQLDLSSASAQEMTELRNELGASKDYMQSLLEQRDAANEELRSANEEILSSNEELQSSNEELEAAKEDMQSVNEELSTVNEQLQGRNRELSQITDDLANVLASTSIPIVIMGHDLRIRRMTRRHAKS